MAARPKRQGAPASVAIWFSVRSNNPIVTTSSDAPAPSKRCPAARVPGGSVQVRAKAANATGARNQKTARQSKRRTSSPAMTGPSAVPMPNIIV